MSEKFQARFSVVESLKDAVEKNYAHFTATDYYTNCDTVQLQGIDKNFKTKVRISILVNYRLAGFILLFLSLLLCNSKNKTTILRAVTTAVDLLRLTHMLCVHR